MPSKSGWLILAVAGYAVFALYPSDLFERLQVFIFQTRDLQRAAQLASGAWIHYGPEMTGGGNLPGPFYYILLAVPMMFGGDWISSWALMVGFAALACVIGWLYLRARLSVAAAWMWVGLFALSAGVFRLLTFFMNVSFILPFVVATVICAVESVCNPTATGRRKALIWGGLLSGLAAQLHFSAVLPFVAMVVIQALARPCGWPLQPARNWGASLAAFALPLVPFVAGELILAAGFNVGQAKMYAGAAGGAPASLAHLIRFAAEFPLVDLLSDASAKIGAMLPWAGVPLALASFIITGGERAPALWRPLAVCAAVSVVPFSYYFFATIGIRYGAPFLVALLFLAALFFHHASRSEKRLKLYNLLTGIAVLGSLAYAWVEDPLMLGAHGVQLLLAAALPLLALLLSSRPGMAVGVALFLTLSLASLQSSLVRWGEIETDLRLMPGHRQWLEIWRAVIQQTGWNYDEATRRLYFVNHHLEQSGALAFHSVKAELETTPVAPVPGAPDGFFVAFRGPPLTGPKGARRWLLEQNLPAQIKRGLESGDISLDDSLSSSFFVVPYRVRDGSVLPKHFHNHGQGYFGTPLEARLEEVPGREGVRQSDDGTLIFKWNDCPGTHRFCSTGALVRVSREAVEVTVAGSAISQVSPWVSPSWTEKWDKPYLEVQCDGLKKQFPIAEEIGYSRAYSATDYHPLLWGNHSLVAPVTRRFKLGCRRVPRQVTIGMAGRQVETVYQVKSLPARELSIHL